MDVWIVMESDGDFDSVAAVYADESLANQDADEMGGYVVGATVRSSLRDEVTDPIAKLKRQEAACEYRRRIEHADQVQHQNYVLGSACKITDTLERGGKPSLCHCAVFSSSDGQLITENGYCRYCGGFESTTFRKHCGERALSEAIDLLDIHNRTRMREIVGEIAEWPDLVLDA